MAAKDIERALNRQLGLEDGDDTPELNVEPEVGEGVDGGAVEVADATDEVVEADQTAEELSEAHEALDEVSEALEEDAANGGISKESARYAHLAIKAACGRFYSPAIAQAIPSVESFGGSSSRLRNTQIALESIGSMLKSFWDAIVRQIKKLWATVKNWYLKVLDAAPRMKKKAEALAKKSADITGAADEKSFDLGQMHQLHINGKAPDAAKMTSIMKDLSKLADNALGGKTSGQYDGIFDEYEAILGKVSDVQDNALKGFPNLAAVYAAATLKGAASSLNSKATAVSSNAKSSFSGATKIDGGEARYGKDITAVGSNELPGGRQIVALESKLTPADDNFTLVRYSRGTGLRFGDFKQKGKDIDGTGTFKTLSSAEIRSICDEISDVCEHIMTYKKAWEARDKQFNKMDSEAKKAIANVEKDKDAAPMKTRLVKDVAMGMSAVYQMGIRFETQLINYLLAVGRSTIVWVERSIAQYK